MDSEGLGYGNTPSSVDVSMEETLGRDEEDVETSLLLLPALKKGGMTARRQRSRGKKVQWNDCNGNKLVEVMEFQPSDSSDSEDEYGDSCICTIM